MPLRAAVQMDFGAVQETSLASHFAARASAPKTWTLMTEVRALVNMIRRFQTGYEVVRRRMGRPTHLGEPARAGRR